jgi:serine protease Do
MNAQFKTLAIGMIGGLLPLGAFLYVQKSSSLPLSDQVIDGNHLNHAKMINMPAFNPEMTDNFVAAAENSINSVVHVTTKTVRTAVQRDPFYEFFYGPGSGNREFKQYGSGSGSGVIVSSEGYIVTNNHVIDQASEIEVTLNDNSKYTATIVGSDPSTDLAVLKIEAKIFESNCYRKLR